MTDTRRLLRQAAADAGWLAEHWRYLVEVRIPGTARPWRQTEMAPERRDQLDREARAERLERDGIAPGEARAPVHVDVLDVLIAGGQWFGLDVPAGIGLYADSLSDLDDDGLAAAAVALARLKAETAAVLRLVYDGQRLGRCPFCRQDRALVVRLTADADPLVVCESDRVCEPKQADCGIYVRGFPPRLCVGAERGRPAWRWTDWEWLGRRIVFEEASAPAYLAPARPVKVYVTPGGCRLWQGARTDTPGPGLPRSCDRSDCIAPGHIIREREAVDA